SPADAVVLQAIAKLESALDPGSDADGVLLADAKAESGLPDTAFQVSVNALVAFGLVSDIPTIRWGKQKPALYFDDESVRLSPLGRAFVVACSPPTKVAA